MIWREMALNPKNSYLPFFNLGIDLFANPAIRKVIYRAELSFMAGNYVVNKQVAKPSTITTERFTVEHKFAQYTAQFTPQVILNLYNTNQLKFFVSAGASLNFSAYDKSVLTTHYTESFYGARTIVKEDPIDFARFYFSPRLNTGLVFNNKLEMFAGYRGLSSTTKYLSYNVGVQRISLGLNWMLGKN